MLRVAKALVLLFIPIQSNSIKSFRLMAQFLDESPACHIQETCDTVPQAREEVCAPLSATPRLLRETELRPASPYITTSYLHD